MEFLLYITSFFFLAILGIASPLENGDTSNIVPRQSSQTCSAVLRRGKQALKSRELLPVDGNIDLDLEKRTYVKGAQCHVSGIVGKHHTPADTRNWTSLQSCADWCKCSLDRPHCRSFNWKENPQVPGLGTCEIYTRGLKFMHFVASTEDCGYFYERGCYKKEWTSSPPTYQTTKLAPRHAAPTQMPAAVKRADSTEKFWALALADD